MHSTIHAHLPREEDTWRLSSPFRIEKKTRHIHSRHPSPFSSLQSEAKASRIRKHVEGHEDGSACCNVGIHERQTAQATEARHRQIRGKGKLEDGHSATHEVIPQLHGDDSLCAKCAKLDLQGALQKAAQIRESKRESRAIWTNELWDGIHIANVGHRYRRLRRTKCALCAMLFTSRIDLEASAAAQDDGDEIRLIGFLHSVYFVLYPTNFWYQDSAHLVVVPRPFPPDNADIDYRAPLLDHVQNEGASVLLADGDEPAMFATQAVPALVDAKIAKGWLHYCQRNHSLRCGSSESPSVSGLRLIECATHAIREAESDMSYAALSYVWGGPGKFDTKVRCTSDNIGLLPVKLSPVITDAINITMALGFQYLWVDKFCIDQDNPDTKHKQIKQMSDIYENADLTIVAAAGIDETYGLPGVGQRRIVSQNTARFNGLRVISTMMDPHVSIRSSYWATRGWTFQEAVLSRRRLVFTDQQLYFECNSMNCSESISSPLDTLHIEDKSRSPDSLRAGMAGMLGRGSTEKFGHLAPGETFFHNVFESYLSLIQEYSSRNLRYDSDSLTAFEGIIQRYSNLKVPVPTIWGMPYDLISPTHEVAPFKITNQSSCFSWAMTWSHKPSSCFSWAMTWSHKPSCWEGLRRPRRRQAFPSWTWAGWAGAIQFLEQERVKDHGPPLSIKNCIQSVGFGSLDEVNKPFASFNHIMPEFDYRYHVLRVRADAVPPKLFSCNRTKNGKISWKLDNYEAEFFPSWDYMLKAQFAQDLMDILKWRCIWVCSFSKRSFVIILEHDHDTDTWTRAGMFYLRCSYLDIELVNLDRGETWFDIV